MVKISLSHEPNNMYINVLIYVDRLTSAEGMVSASSGLYS